jgi:hypothetical protein
MYLLTLVYFCTAYLGFTTRLFNVLVQFQDSAEETTLCLVSDSLGSSQQ